MVTKSELVTVISSLLSSGVTSVSTWSWVLLIVFNNVCPPVPDSTKTSIVNVSVIPVSKVPIVQTPGLVIDPVLGVLDT